MISAGETDRGKLNVLIASVQVPFTHGGAEVLVTDLRRELERRNCVVDVVQLPFTAQPKTAMLRQIAMWRALEVQAFAGRKVDLVICTKFPSYLLSHPCKVLWLIHQHRQVYDLYNTRFGDFWPNIEDESLRRMLLTADEQGLKECQAVYTISPNVSLRLERFMKIHSIPLLPPLRLQGQYRSEQPENFVLSVGRLCSIKRTDLLIRAMARVNGEVRLKIVGLPDEPAIEEYLQSEIDKHHLWERVEFLGRVTDDELLALYARALAVCYLPYDEDYGFVSLEALASGRPVITATDSGGTLEFISNEVNGLVVEPDERAVAQAVNRLHSDRQLFEKLSQGAHRMPLASSWDEIISSLTKAVKSTQVPRLFADQALG